MIHDLSLLVRVRTETGGLLSFGSYHGGDGDGHSYLWMPRFTPPAVGQVAWHGPALYQTWQRSSRVDMACWALPKRLKLCVGVCVSVCVCLEAVCVPRRDQETASVC